MRINHQFRTRCEAVAYLKARGWQVIDGNRGGTNMKHPEVNTHINRILRNGQTGYWGIYAA